MLGSTVVVPPLMAAGWSDLPSVAPAAAEVVLPLLDDPTALLAALDNVPHTFVHGDWKAGNLGEHADGRTIVLDWGEFPGEASPLADLAWYVALNAARSPPPMPRRRPSREPVTTAHLIEPPSREPAKPVPLFRAIGRDGITPSRRR